MDKPDWSPTYSHLWDRGPIFNPTFSRAIHDFVTFC